MPERRRNRGNDVEEAKRLSRAVSAVLDGDNSCDTVARMFQVCEQRLRDAVRGKRLMMGGHNRSRETHR